MAEVEKELLNGQSAQGPPTAGGIFVFWKLAFLSELLILKIVDVLNIA